mgnify:CR=1 FL=1
MGLLVAGGCGVKPEEPPVVFAKMMQVMSNLEQAKFSGEFKLLGNSNVPLFKGLKDLQISGTGEVNLADAQNTKYLLNLTISGMGDDGKTEIGTELRSFPDRNYFRITQISLPMGLPFSLAADKKWYQIKSGGQNSDWLGFSQPITNEQVVNIRQLIAASQLFNVVQKFPDETVGGSRVYHWQVAVDTEAVRKLLQDWSAIAQPATPIDVDKWTARLSDYKYEFWINKYDHKLSRANIKGWYDSAGEQRADFAVVINFNKFNTAVNIERPSNNNVQEFDLRQMLGLPNTTF